MTAAEQGVACAVQWIEPRTVIHRGSQRAGALADFQLVCGAGSYELDILIRELEAPLRIEIGGQVTRGGELHEPVADLPIALVTAVDADVVTETSTDEFGEFVFDSQRQGRYGVRVGEGQGAPCIILWDGGMR